MKLEQLSRQLELPPRALEAFQNLAPEQLDELASRVDAVLKQHEDGLDTALETAIPRVLRTPLLRWLRR